jgi:hypothetical protein
VRLIRLHDLLERDSIHPGAQGVQEGRLAETGTRTRLVRLDAGGSWSGAVEPGERLSIVVAGDVVAGPEGAEVASGGAILWDAGEHAELRSVDGATIVVIASTDGEPLPIAAR